MAKLKNILTEVFEDKPQIDKYKVVEGVKNFGIVGKQLYNIFFNFAIFVSLFPKY